MNKRLQILLSFVLIFVFLAGYAPTVDAAPTLQGDTDTFTLAELNETEIRMFGPFSSHVVLFGLPSNWLMQGGAELSLDMSVSIRNLTTQTGGFAGASVYGGTLTVILNKQPIAVLPLSESGLVQETISIPPAALTPQRDDGRMELSFVLSSGEACLLDQQMDITIYSSSQFTLPHTLVDPDTNLVNFPRPIYQDSIFPDTAVLVVPDSPTEGELQSAYTVAAGLQARTGDQMILDMTTSSELTDQQKANNHVILVGKSGTLPLFSDLSFPMGIGSANDESSGDVGVLEMVPSPWSQERVVLAVSGKTDDAVFKAAQALSTGTIRSNRAPNLALIESVNDTIYQSATPIDQTLANLGYDNVVFEGRGETVETFQFYIPAGQTLTTESFFEISLSHSVLLDYNQSGLFVLLNDQPIGSVAFNDTTANQANNRIRVALPPSAIKSGLNNLDVVAILEPVDECSDPDQAGLFATLWSESRLFLPLGFDLGNQNSLPELANFPAPFTESPSLETTAFVLEKDNPSAWEYAFRVAANMGAIADGAIMSPKVFFADNVPEEELPNYNFFVVGVPNKLPFLNNINDQLPAPFEEGTNNISENYLQIEYQIAPETPVGYLELFGSPWNSEKNVIAALGNADAGLSWAVDSLLLDDTRETMMGDFVVVDDGQVLSADTRFAASQGVVAPPTSEAASGLDVAAPAAVDDYLATNNSWILPALGVTGALIIIVIIGAIILGRRRNKGIVDDAE